MNPSIFLPRPSYRSILLNHELDNLEFHDLDGEIIQAFKLCSGNDVISFWNDPEWIQDLKNTGLSRVIYFGSQT